MTFKNPDIETLATMHTYARPHGSEGEELFIKRYIDTLPNVKIDGFGNRHVTIDGNPALMFSSHTDTVHMAKAKPRQDVTLENDILKLANPEKGYCLGADDGAGVFLMREMIAAKIPALYIFHRQEESGGVGSRYIAEVTPNVLADIDIAIAFDRLGHSSVITHQGARTASDTFCNELADAIGIRSLAADSTGLFTDTAHYNHLVSECTNVSVGYANNHTCQETLDTAFLFTLKSALLKVNWDTLKPSRDPDAFDDDDYPTPAFYYNTEDDLVSLISEYPELAATMMESYGLTREDFQEEIFNVYGDY